MALTINRNRFLHGLSDLSKIVDDGGIPDAPIFTVPPTTTVSLAGSNIGTNPSSSNTWIEQELIATSDGVQVIQLDFEVGGQYFLYINGLKQSKSAYSVSGLSLLLPSTLQIESGDTICFDYIEE
jgi:hypothetical protein